jgi:hypothetical protein
MSRLQIGRPGLYLYVPPTKRNPRSPCGLSGEDDRRSSPWNSRRSRACCAMTLGSSWRQRQTRWIRKWGSLTSSCQSLVQTGHRRARPADGKGKPPWVTGAFVLRRFTSCPSGSYREADSVTADWGPVGDRLRSEPHRPSGAWNAGPEGLELLSRLVLIAAALRFALAKKDFDEDSWGLRDFL